MRAPFIFKEMNVLSLSIGIPTNSAKWWRISNISNQLQKRGHKVYHICYGKRSESSKSNNNGLEKLQQCSEDVTIVDSNLLKAPVIHLRDHLSTEYYDCVYGNNHFGTFLGNLSEFRGVPVIYDIHGDIVHEHLIRGRSEGGHLGISTIVKSGKLLPKIVIKRSNLIASSKVLCVSQKMVDQVRAKGIDERKIAYVPNGVDLDFFSPFNKIPDSTIDLLKIERELVFGYVGGFQEWQGVHQLISIAKNTHDDDIGFLIVGKFEGVKRNIQFVPRIQRVNVPKYYSLCDVLVLPRPHHPATEVAAPTKFVEYAAMGKPILSTNVGDAPGLIRKYDCGIVVEDNCETNIRRGINEFKHLSDFELAEMGRNARLMALKEFDWDDLGDSLSMILQELV